MENLQAAQETYLLPASDAEIILSDIELASFFEEVAKRSKSPRTSANIIISDILSYIKEGAFSSKIPPKSLAALSDMFFDERINSSTQKKLTKRMWEDGIDPLITVRDEDLLQINDEEALTAYVKEAIEENPRCADDYRRGKKAAAKTILGKAMAKSRGKANPRILSRIAEAILGENK